MQEAPEQTQAQRRRAVQQAITSVFAESPSLERVAAEILGGICRALGWDAGVLWRIDPTARALRPVESWFRPALRAEAFEAATRAALFEPGVGLPGRVWQRGRPVWIRDVEGDAGFPRAPAAARAGLHAAFGFPILLEGEVLGVMEFFHHEIHEPDEELLELLATVGVQIGQFLRRKQAEAEARQRAEQHRFALESAETGTWDLDPATGEAVWSDNLFVLYGLDPARAVPSYETWWECLHPEDRGRMEARYREDLRRKATRFHDEFRIVHPEKGVRWMLTRGKVAYREDGSPDRMMGTVVDVTEQRQAQAALEETERDYRGVFENAAVGIVLADASGRFLQVNERFASMLGRGRADLARLTYRDVTHPEDLPAQEGKIEALQRGEMDSYAVDKRYLHADGSVVWGRLTLSAVRDEAGRPLYLVGVLEDIGERKSAETALKELNARLEQRVAERTRELREAQALVNGVLDSSLDGIAALRSVRDAEGAIVDFEWLLLNRQAQRLLGPASEGFVGRRLLETLPGNRDLGLFDVYVRVVETGEPATNLFRYDQDGIRGWFQNIAVKFDDGFAATFRDVTREKEEEQVREALTAAQLGTYEYLLRSGEVVASPGLDAIYGLPHREGRRDPQEFLARIHPEDQQAAQDVIRAYEEGRARHRGEYRIIRPDGTQRWIHARSQVLPGADGAPARVLGVVLDITERKEADIALQEVNRSLEARVRERTSQFQAANRELEAFSYSISHDLRAPLRSIHGFSDALLEDYADALDDTGRAYLDRVQSGVERMQELIDAMLELARQTRREIRPRDVDIAELARGAARELQEREPQRGVHVSIEGDLTARGDESLLRAAVQNLVGNAFKYTRGKDPARVEVGAFQQRGERVFFVRDNGVGFDPRYADRLFTPFSRLHRQEEFEGSGIGLATVQRVIHRHGGRIWAESEPGRGSTFYFTLDAEGGKGEEGAGSA